MLLNFIVKSNYEFYSNVIMENAMKNINFQNIIKYLYLNFI